MCLQGQGGSQAHSATGTALEANEKQWNDDFTAKDVDKLVAHYSDDATLMSPGAPAARGKEAIRAVLKEMVSDPAFSLKFKANKVLVSKSGDMAFTEGSYALSLTNPTTKQPMTDKGSYVTVYRKGSDGKWRAVSDIASSESMPAGGATQ